MLANRWNVRQARRREAAAARRAVADAELYVRHTASLLDYADWLYERWPDARLVVSRPSRSRALVEIAYAGAVQDVTLHEVDIAELYKLTRWLLAVGETRVVHPLAVGTDLAPGETAHS